MTAVAAGDAIVSVGTTGVAAVAAVGTIATAGTTATVTGTDVRDRGVKTALSGGIGRERLTEATTMATTATEKTAATIGMTTVTGRTITKHLCRTRTALTAG